MITSSRDVLSALDRRVPESVIAKIDSRADSVVVPHPAASVVLLRDHEGGVETYALHRHSRMPFAAGMVVFPGGRLDPVDGVLSAGYTPTSGPLLRCAVRETEEETGVRLEPEQLQPWAHWITPELEPRRYDTFFYLAELPVGQTAADISGETWKAEWRTPAALLAAADAGELALMPPTRSILIELDSFATVADALAGCPDRRVETVLPRVVRGPAGWIFDYSDLSVSGVVIATPPTDKSRDGDER
ncbi:NUDIX domain-containing protein [Microlunatus elymi]|uniref:NUDIX domain-containing protein n=1 Tax=Microlunatus elymi TaxID=2596828 RepID=A0A516PV79_9ACTN|nr:NUDIX domain-containing protein [Microlunatus elymi]QDP95095.1 NUDIX domain-containing protein [Microlunatus elymi]